MAKRILSLVLSVALLLGCVSGLALISSAASTTAAFDASVPGWCEGVNLNTAKDGFNTLKFNSDGQAYWNNGVVAKAFGVETMDIDSLSVTFDYYYDCSGEGNNVDGWVAINTTGSDDRNVENTVHTNGGWVGGENALVAEDVKLVANEWSTVTYTIPGAQKLGGGHDVGFKLAAAGTRAMYIRGMKVVVTSGEDTYTALWGSFQVATIDFTSGEAVGTNAAIVDTPQTSIEEIVAESGDYGMKMTTHNQGFRFSVDNVGITGDVAVTVEYLAQSEHVGNNTRFNMNFGGKDHILRVQGATFDNTMNGPGDDLTKDADAAYTYVVTGDEAAALADGETIQTLLWNDFDGNYYFIKSISIMPASMLAAAPADPGYKYYDNVATYAKNPFYPQYTTPMSYGMGVAIGDNGGMAYYSVTSDKADIGIKFIMKEDATATGLSIDYQTTTEGDGWKGTNGIAAEVIDGVAIYTFDNAVFQNGLNGLGSFRMGMENASQVARVEVYELQDMTALNEAIAAAKATDTAGKTAATIAKLNAAIAAAEAVAANSWATAADIAAATNAMTAAIDGLKAIPVITYGSKLHCTDAVYISGNGRTENDNTDFDSNFIGWTSQGDNIDFEINVEADGLYNITVLMVTGAAEATVELQDGNGKVYGSAVVPQSDWGGTYVPYTITAPLKAGAQTLRIYFANSVANVRNLTFGDARYTLTNVTGFQANWGDQGSIVLYDGSYAWKFNTDGDGNNKGLSLGGYNNILSESATIVYEIEAQFEQQANSFTVWYGQGQDDPETTDKNEGQTNNTFGASVDATGAWFTYTHTVENYNNGGNYADTPLTMFGHPGADGNNLYIKSFKAYDPEDPTKVVSIVFADATSKVTLQAEVDAALTDGSAYSAETWEAYQAALTAAQEILDRTDATQDEIDAAVANLKAAKAALADKRYTLNNATSNMNPNSTNLQAGMIVLKDNQYAWKVGGPEAGKFMGIGDPNGILNDATSVIYEYDIFFDCAANLNARVFLGYGKKGAGWIDVRDNGDDFNGFAAHGNWFPNNGVGTAPANGEWGTIAVKNDNYDPSILNQGCITLLGFWNENCDIYVKAIRAYDANDPTKMISLTFTKIPGKDDLQVALDNAVDLDGYTAASAEAYTAALEAIEALLAQETVTEQEVLDALAALEAAEAALALAQATITFENDTINTMNGNILHNHPDEDDADADNGIYEIVAESGIYGIKVSKQNRGFGFGINNDSGWLTTDTDIKLTVTYYAPSEVVQDNTRMPFQISGKGWHTARVGEADVDVSPLAKDEVASFTYTLTAEEAEAIIANGNVFVHFWNYNDNPDTGADYIYVTAVRIENAKPADKTDLQAAVDAAIEDLSDYTEESAAAYTAALEAAKAVLANEEATADDIEKAMADLTAAAAALEKQTYDVIVVDISTTEGDKPKVGNTVFFTFTVKNNGENTIPAGALYGGIVKIGETMIGWSDNYKNVDVAPALAPGETIVLTLCGGGANGDGSWVVTAEAVEVFAQVNDNPAQGINESNLDNNTYTETITPTTLDLAAINAAIADVEAIENLDEYTEESVAALNEALAAAKAAAAKADATQDEIDAAKAALEAAKAALEKKPAPVEGLLGDVNGDDVVNTTDARVILQYAAELIEETALDLTVADVDGDGVVNTTDARLILQFAAEIITEFPAAAK